MATTNTNDGRFPPTSAQCEERYRLLMEAVPHGIQECDRDGVITFSNPAHAKMHGVEVDQLIGTRIWELLENDSEKAKLQEYFGMLVNEQPTPTPYFATNRTSDGRRVDVQVDWTYKRDETGYVTGFVSVITDITARRQSEAQLRTIVDTALSHIMVLDLEGNIQFINRTVEGLSIEQAIGTSVYEYGPPEANETIRIAIDYVVTTGKPYQYETLSLGDCGAPAWYLCRMGPQIIDGQVKALTLCAMDITDKKLAEQLSNEKETQLNDLLSNVGAIVLEGDPFNIYYVGGQVERILGYPKALWFKHPQGPVGFKSDILHPDDAEKVAICRQAIQRGEDHCLEYRLIGKDGNPIWFYDSVVVETRNGKPVKTRSVMIDITERKKSEETLRASEEMARLILNATHDSVFLIDCENWTTLSVNERAARKLGKSVSEIVGLKIEDMLPTDIAERRKARAAEVMVSGQPIFYEDQRQGLHFDNSIYPVFGPCGNVIQLAIFAQDITHRKQLEKRLQQQHEKLAHITRLSTMGEMATGLAHELNQPLCAILLYASEGERVLQGDEPIDQAHLRDLFQKLTELASRSGEIIRRLRRLVGRQPPVCEHVNIVELIQQTLELVKSDFRKDEIRVEQQIEPGGFTASIDEIQIQQVLLNLLLNARDSMLESEDDQRKLKISASQTENGLIEVAICDSGSGIPEEMQGEIFNAFYSTKSEGMGMGLAIGRSIIESHGGSLWVTPNDDRGMTFRFTIPTTADASTNRKTMTRSNAN